MVDREYDGMAARYVADMEKHFRERLAEATELIGKFTTLATSKGVTLRADSFQYIQTIGVVAKAQGIARALVGSISAERDGLLTFHEIAERFPAQHEGCFAGARFRLDGTLLLPARNAPDQ